MPKEENPHISAHRGAAAYGIEESEEPLPLRATEINESEEPRPLWATEFRKSLLGDPNVTRSILAFIVMGIVIAIIAGSFWASLKVGDHNFERLKWWMGLVWSSVVPIVTLSLGYYYGSHQKS